MAEKKKHPTSGCFLLAQEAPSQIGGGAERKEKKDGTKPVEVFMEGTLRMRKEEVIIFLVGLSLSSRGHSAEAIRRKLDREYGIEVSRKRIHDILKYMSEREYINVRIGWGRHNKRNEYPIQEENPSQSTDPE